jgi:hypothetical protein
MMATSFPAQSRHPLLIVVIFEFNRKGEIHGTS